MSNGIKYDEYFKCPRCGVSGKCFRKIDPETFRPMLFCSECGLDTIPAVVGDWINAEVNVWSETGLTGAQWLERLEAEYKEWRMK